MMKGVTTATQSLLIDLFQFVVDVFVFRIVYLEVIFKVKDCFAVFLLVGAAYWLDLLRFLRSLGFIIIRYLGLLLGLRLFTILSLKLLKVERKTFEFNPLKTSLSGS